MNNNAFLEGFVEECSRLEVPEEAVPGLYKQAVTKLYLLLGDEAFTAGYKQELTKNAMSGDQVDALIERESELLLDCIVKSAGPSGWGARAFPTFIRGAKSMVQGSRNAAKNTLAWIDAGTPMHRVAPAATTAAGAAPAAAPAAGHRGLKALGLGAGALGLIAAGIPLGDEWRRGMFVPLRKRYFSATHTPEEINDIYEQGGGGAAMSEKERTINAMNGDVMSLLDNPSGLDAHLLSILAAKRQSAELKAMHNQANRMETMQAVGGNRRRYGGYYGGWDPSNYGMGSNNYYP